MSRKNSVALFIIILLIAIAIGDALFKQSALTKDVSSEHLDVQDNLVKRSRTMWWQLRRNKVFIWRPILNWRQ